jgi:hypothetical protein
MKPMTCSHGRALNWPRELWIGIDDNSWVIDAFVSADHAAAWANSDPGARHAYRVEATITATVEYVPPVPETHRIIPYPPVIEDQ